VPEGSRGVTQAKRLEKLPERLCEVTHLMTGEEVAPEDRGLEIHHDSLGNLAAEIREERAPGRGLRTLTRHTAEVARQLRDHGLSLRDVGTMVGVSYQRVHQSTGPPAPERQLNGGTSTERRGRRRSRIVG
jgi:hypothetical protein